MVMLGCARCFPFDVLILTEPRTKVTGGSPSSTSTNPVSLCFDFWTGLSVCKDEQSDEFGLGSAASWKSYGTEANSVLNESFPRSLGGKRWRGARRTVGAFTTHCWWHFVEGKA